MVWVLLWFVIGYSTAAFVTYKELLDNGEVTLKTLAIAVALGLLGPLLTIIVGIIFCADFFEVHGDKVVIRRTDKKEGG